MGSAVLPNKHCLLHIPNKHSITSVYVLSFIAARAKDGALGQHGVACFSRLDEPGGKTKL
eukprot:45317-Eustigmatos_ZCMA.PRE.1